MLFHNLRGKCRNQEEFINKQVEMGIESLHVEVDGGIGPSNARRAAEAGADVLVAGSSVFRGEGTVTENYGAIQRALAVDV